MATKKKSVKTDDIMDLGDNAFGHRVLDAKAEADVLKKFIDGAKAEAFSRIEDHGVQEGNHFVIRDGDILLKKEVRTTVIVKDEEAAKLLRAKKMEGKVDVTATIEIKKGVNPETIPDRLKKEIEKYFDIKLHHSVQKEVLVSLKDEGQITQAQYAKCVEEKKVEAFKVEQV